MANLLSPGIQVSEVDQSQITPTEGDSAAVFGGDFEKGPVGVHTLISTVQELRDNYGMPNTKNYNDYYQVQNFLAYSGAIYVSRAADLNGTPTQLDGLLFEENAYKTNVNATKVEDVKVIGADSVDVKFEKTDKFQVGQVLKINDSNKEYKIKYIRNEIKQIPNPDYQPLTQLIVEPSESSVHVDEVVNYVITTDAETYEVETDKPDVVLINKSNKSLTALKAGSAIVTFRAAKEGSRPNKFELRFDVQEKESTKLIVSPEQLDIIKGQQGVLNIDTDADDYLIISKNLGIATIENDKKTVNGVREGSTTIEITAQAQGKNEVIKTITVNVNEEVKPEIEGVSVEPENISIAANDSVASIVVTKPEGSTIEAQSDRGDIASVEVQDSNVQVTPIAEGSANITITIKKDSFEDKIITVPVTIEKPKIKAQVDPESVSVKADAGDQTLTVNVQDIEDATIVARSENPEFANVESQGESTVIRPVAEGETKIIFTISKDGYQDLTIEVPFVVASTTPAEIVINSPKVNVDRLVEEQAKSNLDSVNVEFDKVSNIITITGDINDLQEYPSSVAIQGSGKWIPLEIGTGLPTIVGAKFDGAELTEADRREALGLGMAEGSFVLWIKATEDYDRDITVEKDGVIKTIKIKFNNTPKETPTPTPEEGDEVIVIGGDEDIQNPTQDTDTDITTGTDTETGTTDEMQDENQESGEGFDRVSEVVSFGDEVTGNDGDDGDVIVAGDPDSEVQG